MFAFAAAAPRLGGALGQAAIHGLKLVAVVVVAHGVLGMARQLTPDAPRRLIGAGAMLLEAARAYGREPAPAQSEVATPFCDRMRAIVDEWRTVNGLDRKTDDALWKRYSAARDGFNRRRGAHFAELDRERVGIREAKEKLCARAEELSGSTDWAPTAAKFRDLLNEWKAAGRASKDLDETLWQRFKAAQDTFFAARNAVSVERDAEFVANGAAKEKLLADAEKIDIAKLDAARAALRTITDKWDAIGNAPGDRSADLDRRLRAVEKKIRDASETSRADPEAQARAEQFRARADQFERQAEKAAAAGRTKDADAARASASQWREWADTAVAALKRR